MKEIADKDTELAYIQHVLSIGEENPGRLNAELAQESINKECFTVKNYWEIYCAAKDICRQGERLDESLIAAALGPESKGEVHLAWPSIPRYSSLRLLGSTLRQFTSRRAAYAIGKEIVRAAQGQDGDYGDSLVRAAAAIQSAFSPDGSGVETGETVLLRFYEELEAAQTGDYKLQIIPTGIVPLDEVTGGLPRRFLSLIGAYPGCFKSGIMATIAANLAVRGVKVGFFSLEDNPTWLAKRYVSRATNIAVEDLGRRRLREAEMQSLGTTQQAVLDISKNLLFDGRSGLSGLDVASSARYMIAQHKAEVIIIDHIGEIQSREKRKDRYDLEVADGVRHVRDLAKDTGVAVLMAAHLKRKSDADEDIHRVPRMTDFADSSALERMCRLAMGLWQPPDSPDKVCLKVLKVNEGGSRGRTFMLTKNPRCALVMNT